MEFRNEKNGEFMIIEPVGRMDAVTAPEFEEECNRLIQSGELRMVAHMGSLDYISSAGLRSILASAKKLKSMQGEIRFCGLTGMVEEVFSISGFSSMFPIFNTVDDALKG